MAKAKKSERNKKEENDIVNKGEEYIKRFLADNGDKTIREISEYLSMTNASTHRYVSSLLDKGEIVRVGTSRVGKYTLKN